MKRIFICVIFIFCLHGCGINFVTKPKMLYTNTSPEIVYSADHYNAFYNYRYYPLNRNKYYHTVIEYTPIHNNYHRDFSVRKPYFHIK